MKATNVPLNCAYQLIFCSCSFGCYFVIKILMNIMGTVKSPSVWNALDEIIITHHFRFSVVKKT